MREEEEEEVDGEQRYIWSFKNQKSAKKFIRYAKCRGRPGLLKIYQKKSKCEFYFASANDARKWKAEIEEFEKCGQIGNKSETYRKLAQQVMSGKRVTELQLENWDSVEIQDCIQVRKQIFLDMEKGIAQLNTQESESAKAKEEPLWAKPQSKCLELANVIQNLQGRLKEVEAENCKYQELLKRTGQTIDLWTEQLMKKRIQY